MLTPDDVVHQRFETVRFRRGYDQDEVDDFLDVVVQTLRAYREGIDPESALLADELPAVTFTTTRLRDGYDPGEVDAFLDRIQETLRAHEQRLR